MRNRTSSWGAIDLKRFPPEQIRNVALVGHGGSGKTTLAEALLHCAGAINRVGRVEDGTTVTDFDPEEQKRGLSLSLALAPFEWKDHKVNLIDCPGYADFVGDVHAALRVADLAVFVVSAVEGVEVQTYATWKIAAELGVPRMVFVNKLDRERANFERTLEQLRDRFGAGVAPLELPIGEEAVVPRRGRPADRHRVLLRGRQRRRTARCPTTSPTLEHQVHDNLVEGIVVADDELLERYLDGEEISTDELEHTLAKGVAEATVFPVVVGSATSDVARRPAGRLHLRDRPLAHRPSAGHREGRRHRGRGRARPERRATRVRVQDDRRPVRRPHLVVQGAVRHDPARRPPLQLALGRRRAAPRPVHPAGQGAGAAERGAGRRHRGGRQAHGDRDRRHARTEGQAGDGRADRQPAAGAGHRHPRPDAGRRGQARQRAAPPAGGGPRRSSSNAARRPSRPSCAARARRICRSRSRSWRASSASTSTPRTCGCRTARRSRAARHIEGKHKKQSGGHGQFGVAVINVEPLPRGEGFEFVDKIVGGAIARGYIPAVQKGIEETMASGGVFGYPIVDVKVELVDGKQHAVDSSEMAFKIAGRLAIREAMAKADPVLLEPISLLEVTVPAEYQGDVMGDLNARRGRVQGTETAGDGEQTVTALVPTSEILRYAIDLRSLTGGRGRFTRHATTTTTCCRPTSSTRSSGRPRTRTDAVRRVRVLAQFARHLGHASRRCANSVAAYRVPLTRGLKGEDLDALLCARTHWKAHGRRSSTPATTATCSPFNAND